MNEEQPKVSSHKIAFPFAERVTRVRILPKDATRAYLMPMCQSGGRLKVLPNDLYDLDEAQMLSLTDSGIEFKRIDGSHNQQKTPLPKAQERGGNKS